MSSRAQADVPVLYPPEALTIIGWPNFHSLALAPKPATRPGDLALAYLGFTFVPALTIAPGGQGHSQ